MIWYLIIGFILGLVLFVPTIYVAMQACYAFEATLYGIGLTYAIYRNHKRNNDWKDAKLREIAKYVLEVSWQRFWKSFYPYKESTTFSNDDQWRPYFKYTVADESKAKAAP